MVGEIMSKFMLNSGRLIDINCLCVDDIDIKDIAHHLTKICRYGGSLPLDVHYSVASHSVSLANYCSVTFDKDTAKVALLHDAAEAYIGDMVAGVKAMCQDYKDLDHDITRLIADKYKLSLDPFIWEMVHYLDKRLVLDEARGLFPDYFHIFQDTMPGVEELGIDVRPDPYDLTLTYQNYINVYNMFFEEVE